jgi:hypothetical protein
MYDFNYVILALVRVAVKGPLKAPGLIDMFY